MNQTNKPNSVLPTSRDGNYLSSPDIAIGILRSTRRNTGEQPALQNRKNLLLDLAPSGVYSDPDKVGTPFKGTSAITDKAVGFYPTISPVSVS